MKGYVEVPYVGTLAQVDMVADRFGSIVVDIWKCSFAQFDAGQTHPVVADSITGASPPALSAAIKTQNPLSGWTTSLAPGDILGFNVNSVATIQRVTLTLKYNR
jgi:hypothetical protein